MPGHNGGFNPFRDANGEFTNPTGAGKPGRNRAKNGTQPPAASPVALGRVVAGGASTTPRTSPVALGRVTGSQITNPTRFNQAYARSRGAVIPQGNAYRRKGTDPYGQA